MLRYFDSNTNIAQVTHQSDYRRWLSRLTPAQRQAAFNFIDHVLVPKGRIHTSSWMPGADWTNTPLQPLYSVACNSSEQQAGGSSD
jgi:hypothetical protein